MSYDVIIKNLYDMIDDLLDVSISNEKELLDSLLLSFKLRHNAIHQLAAYVLTRDMRLFNEKPAEYYFDNLTEKNKKLTPDMIVFFDKYDMPCKSIEITQRIALIDISVSTTSNYQAEKKEKKYENLRKNIYDITGKETIMYTINVNSNYSNIEKAFYDFKTCIGLNVSLEDIPFSEFRAFLHTLLNTQTRIKGYISNESLVNNFFKKEFGQNLTNDENPDDYNDILTDRLPKLFESYNARIRKNESCVEHFEKCVSDLSIDSETKDNQRTQKFTEICSTLKELLQDQDIRQTYMEKDTTAQKVSDALYGLNIESKKYQPHKIKPSHQMFTPLLDSHRLQDVIPDHEINLSEFKLEQRQILNIMRMISTNMSDIPGSSFISDINDHFKNIFTNEFAQENIHMFNTNCWFSNEIDKRYNEDYHMYRDSCFKNRTPIKSELNFIRENKGKRMPHDGQVRSFKQKMIKVPQSIWSDDSSIWWKKAHAGHKDEKKAKLNKIESSCHLEHSKYVDEMLDLLTESPLVNKDTLNTEFLTTYSDMDSNILVGLKEDMIKDYKPILKVLKYTNAFNYLWTQSLCAEQLMHYTQFSLPSNTFSFFTAGQPNICFVVNNSYHNAGKDVGKAYMIIGYVFDKRWLTPFNGDVKYKECFDEARQKKYYKFITNWRRTETFKLTFLKDQFYSVLSTSMNALLRHRSDVIQYRSNKNAKDYTFDLIRHHFTLKVCISLTTNQRIAEMLSDMRYAIMASFSDFSEIEKLILDKFSPKYGTVFESWVASRVDNLRKQVKEFQNKENIRTFFKQPVFVQGKRRDDSIGGSFEIPSIWTGTIIKDLQDLLDDMFVYVHTLKEPSNIHHENIKAMETIIEYQKKYDKLSKERKQGLIETPDKLKEFLLDSNPIGHSFETVKLSCNRTMSSLKAFDLNLHAKKHFSEKISNITSTKSAIPEYEREIIPLEPKSKKRKKPRNQKSSYEMDQELKRFSESKDKMEFIKEYSKMTNSKLKPKQAMSIKTNITKESFLPHNNRSKVHDCMLDVLEQNINMSTIFDVAEWNILLNNSRVVSDICIKAQYGAKREFYVINVGAKCNARILENIFSEICKVIPNEMISIPGDKKMLVMQDFLNNCLIKKGANHQLVFVNGDCTKWSAAETMECFMSLIAGLDGFLDESIIKYLLIVVDMWANKKITIPVSILQNTFFTNDDKTEYLNNKDPVIDSQQNFLQGMFNYMSSFKAVCSSNFTRDVWKTIHPESTLDMNHLEHSDDYSLMILSESLEEVKEFRLLHRIVMKLHGFNDSVKKTNTQRFLMEFISLVSLNGHMTYPHIKKLKECGMNLGCTGYRDDIDGAMSRVGESVRVGSILSSAYFMQKCHLWNVSRSYSTLPQQRNSYTNSVLDMMAIPVELFGIPDTHPMLSFMAKGLSNNYRLAHYNKGRVVNVKLDIGSNESVPIDVNNCLLYLMEIQLNKEQVSDSLSMEDFTLGTRLYHPTYIFDIENKLIQKMKSNVKMDFEEATDFWNSHKSYNFIKPQNRHLLVSWMRAMYFKHNFALAYSRNSRSQITLRLSTFTSKDCCILGLDTENNFIKSSISGYLKRFYMDLANNEKTLLEEISGVKKLDIKDDLIMKTLKRAILNCDSAISTLYSLFDNARAVREKEHNRSTVAALTPNKVNWLNINNKPDALIQYIFNYDDFILDNRMNKGLPTLESDKKQLLKHYPEGLSEESTINTIKSVYTDIMLSQPKKNLCMTYSSKIQSIEDFIRIHLEFATIYKVKYSIYTSGATSSTNPHTGDLFYKKLYTYTQNEYRLLIDDAVLIYALMKQAYKVDDLKIKQVLNNLEVKSNYIHNKDLLLKGSDVWENMTIEDLNTMGCTNNELKSFAFIKNFVTNDIEDIYNIINADFSYSYQYLNVKPEYKSIIEEIVEFEYGNRLFKCVFFKNNVPWILTNDNKKHLLTDAYMIGLKLLNKIKLYDLEKRFGTIPLREIQTNQLTNTQIDFFKKNINTMRKFLKEMDIQSVLMKNESTTFNRFTELDSSEIENLTNESLLNIIEINMFFRTNTFEDIPNGKHDFVNKKINIDFEKMAVFNGRRKVFGLPILQAQQSNTTYVRGGFMLNGLDINWWLDNDRIKKLIKKEDIPITKEDFDELTNVLIKDDKILISVQLQSLITRLLSLPNRLFKIIPDEVFEHIETRLSKNVQDSSMTSTAMEFVQNFQLNQQETFDDDEIARELEALGETMSFRPDIDVESVESEFDPNCLDMLMDDMSDIEFENREEDSDDDVEDEIVKVQNDTESSTGSSKNSLINFQDFQFVTPDHITEEVMIIKGGYAKSILESIGDPTQKVIEKMYATDIQLDMITTREKIGLLYRLNDILICSPVLSDPEILHTLSLSNSILETFSKSEEWIIFDDYVLESDEHKNLDIFVKYEGRLTPKQIMKLLDNGGKIKKQRIKDPGIKSKMRGSVQSSAINKIPPDELENYFLIPLSRERKIDALNTCCSSFIINRFCGIKVIEDCYKRLYQENFVRSGFVLELLEELN